MDAPATSSQEVELPDGSRVQLEAGAQVRVEKLAPENTRLVLARGVAQFDVAHRASRSFIVHAGEIDVAVIGTRFRVELTPAPLGGAAHVEVEVQRGTVEVQRTGKALITLEAGERWASSRIVSDVVQAAPTPEPSPASSSVPPPPAAAPPRKGRDAQAALETASTVFDAANRERIAGRSRDAASLFDHLRRVYRSDPRAALAAFQLGRIRMDELGDSAGAIDALNDALALGGGGNLREDAQARLVDAYERSGNASACRRSKAAYLSDHPNGAHQAVVEKRCPY